MADEEQPHTLVEVLDRMADVDGRDVHIGDILDSVGQRSFGSLLLVPSLIVVSPLSGIPGIPTLGAIAIALTAGQMLIGRKNIWLPQFLLQRKINQERFEKALAFLRPAARFLDKPIRPRLVFLTRRPFSHAIAGICVAIAAAMPPLEVLPFASTTTAAAVTLLGLALLAHDGVVALFGVAAAAASLYFAFSALA